MLGSHGSVLHSLTAQIADGGPVTVTHPDVTCFFMALPEAVQLVLQAATIGEDGQVQVLDMGASGRIADVAEYLVRQSGPNSGILFTGLSPGETLDEGLLGVGEVDERPHHRLISQVPVPPLWPSMTDRPDLGESTNEMRTELREWSATRATVSSLVTSDASRERSA